MPKFMVIIHISSWVKWLPHVTVRRQVAWFCASFWCGVGGSRKIHSLLLLLFSPYSSFLSPTKKLQHTYWSIHVHSFSWERLLSCFVMNSYIYCHLTSWSSQEILIFFFNFLARFILSNSLITLSDLDLSASDFPLPLKCATSVLTPTGLLRTRRKGKD